MPVLKKTNAQDASRDIQTLREAFEKNGYPVDEVTETSFRVFSVIGAFKYEVKNNELIYYDVTFEGQNI